MEKLRPNLEEADVGELECSGCEAKMVDAFEGNPKFSLKIWQVEVQFIYLFAFSPSVLYVWISKAKSVSCSG